jgi:hypothetical protein
VLSTPTRLGNFSVTQVRVTTSGMINVDKDNNPSRESRPYGCCSYDDDYYFDSCCDSIGRADAIQVGSKPSRISVAQNDLRPDRGGSVYTRHVTSPVEAFIVSWEDVAVDGGPSVVNAQAALYPNGTVELRWGFVNANSFNIAAGIVDSSVTPRVTLPATVAPFGSNGAPDGIVPDDEDIHNDCQVFSFAQSPTPPPTAPTAAPSHVRGQSRTLVGAV